MTPLVLRAARRSGSASALAPPGSRVGPLPTRRAPSTAGSWLLAAAALGRVTTVGTGEGTPCRSRPGTRRRSTGRCASATAGFSGTTARLPVPMMFSTRYGVHFERLPIEGLDGASGLQLAAHRGPLVATAGLSPGGGAWTSTDTVHWTPARAGWRPCSALNPVWVDGRFIALATLPIGTPAARTSSVWASVDGTTWTKVADATPPRLASLVVPSGKWRRRHPVRDRGPPSTKAGRSAVGCGRASTASSGPRSSRSTGGSRSRTRTTSFDARMVDPVRQRWDCGRSTS